METITETTAAEDIKLVKVFEGAFGKSGTEGLTEALARLEDSSAISLGEKAGQIFTAPSIENTGEIRKWVDMAKPKLFAHVTCDPKRFNKMLNKALKEKYEKERQESYKKRIKSIIKGWKDEMQRLFNIGSQIRRKGKTCRQVIRRYRHTQERLDTDVECSQEWNVDQRANFCRRQANRRQSRKNPSPRL
eukprot:TRINITY_DN1482_c0_g1_i1.p9 TRINITY_DN1482_c0_g1~~TRINITY_DN1482_c0_g1_i1.p9  ORF type:complete len:190 (-),score=15.64 TRINITY_DN1482_c0_g1_i1:1104-1673(-)